MRSWYPIPALCLDSKRLLGEHNELHCMWNVITLGKKGYSKHPETIRWKRYLPALVERHEEIVQEMLERGFNHKSPLTIDMYSYVSLFTDSFVFYPETIEPIEVMRKKLADKIKSSLKQ